MTQLPGAVLRFSAVLLACALSRGRAEAPAAAETVFLHGSDQEYPVKEATGK